MTTTQVPNKSQSSKNALSHGLYAGEVVLPKEKQEAFDDLLESYRDEYCPDGVSENAAVVELAILHWKRRRLETGMQQALQQLNSGRTDTSDALVEVGSGAKVVQLEKAKAHAVQSLTKQAEKVCTNHRPCRSAL